MTRALPGDNGEIVWRDELSVPALGTGTEETSKGELSILSWNVLSQTSEQANEPYSYRGMELTPPWPWEHRLPQILRSIRAADADIICLQEVSEDTFLADLLPPLQTLGGFAGIVQKGKGRYPAVATLWKSDRLALDAHSHRSRTLTTVLRDASDRRLAVINCHLEGHPHKGLERVTQMHHALRDVSLKHSHHGLVVCGDFNCEIHSSALSAYLTWNSVPPGDTGILEWGRPVPPEAADVPSHRYNLTSAYPPELMRDRPFEYFTYCRLPGRPGAGLDQVWFTGGPLARVALLRLFASDEERVGVLKGGIPSEEWPSDHVPIGCVLCWRGSVGDGKKMEDLRASSQTEKSNRTAAEVLAEASELLAACPFGSEDERREFDYIVSNVPGLPEKGKPSPEQIALLADRRERRDKLLASVSDEVQQILQRVLKLRKEAAKLN